MRLHIFFIVALLFSAHPAFAGTSKVIKLKDGTTLVGEITSMANGRYSVKTKNLGEVSFGDDDILNIQPLGAMTESAQPADDAAASLKQQVQEVQSQVMNDEAIMESINELAEDREIQQLLQNPQLMQTIMSFNEQQIANDPAIKELLQRKDIQDIIKQIESKVGPIE